MTYGSLLFTNINFYYKNVDLSIRNYVSDGIF
ncbi:hypothetical protein Ark11_0831 [Candidatus Ichthyocystis hellenicum]|uniref:Uncharacterized protein n=1 Tax=Candidatus Ichthyocystis hellenicum TaxID=1561003 RepID=A0A0S4M5X3_9BURK|nr:hypothetical protein Ark11_0831 [Candidatus Ichthyocystis hellenicum]